MLLTKEVYALTRKFPKEELYGLTSQMRRCAVSVPSNIAEGSQRKTDKDFGNFLFISKGSLSELETQLILAQELNYCTNEEMEPLLMKIDEIQKMLHAFSVKLTAAR